MGKGYAEGPAAEEAQAPAWTRSSSVWATDCRRKRERAVFGSTADDPERHFLGWADEIDADALFEQGEAWGLTVVRRPAG